MRKLLPGILFATPVARLLALVALFYTFYYLSWRVGYSLNLDALWFSVPLLLAEVQGAINFTLFMFMTWDLKPLPHPAAPRGHTGARRGPMSAPPSWLSQRTERWAAGSGPPCPPPGR